MCNEHRLQIFLDEMGLSIDDGQGFSKCTYFVMMSESESMISGIVGACPYKRAFRLLCTSVRRHTKGQEIFQDAFRPTVLSLPHLLYIFYNTALHLKNHHSPILIAIKTVKMRGRNSGFPNQRKLVKFWGTCSLPHRLNHYDLNFL